MALNSVCVGACSPRDTTQESRMGWDLRFHQSARRTRGALMSKAGVLLVLSPEQKQREERAMDTSRWSRTGDKSVPSNRRSAQRLPQPQHVHHRERAGIPVHVLSVGQPKVGPGGRTWIARHRFTLRDHPINQRPFHRAGASYSRSSSATGLPARSQACSRKP